MSARFLPSLLSLLLLASPLARADYGDQLDQNFDDTTPTPVAGASTAVARALQGYRLKSDDAGPPDAGQFVNANGLTGNAATQNFWESSRTGSQANFDSSVTGMNGNALYEMSRHAPAGAGYNSMGVKTRSAAVLANAGQRESLARAIRLFNRWADLRGPGPDSGIFGDPSAWMLLDEAYGAYQAAQAFGATAQRNGQHANIMSFDEGAAVQKGMASPPLPGTGGVVFSPAAQGLLSSLGFDPDLVMSQLQSGDGAIFGDIAVAMNRDQTTAEADGGESTSESGDDSAASSGDGSRVADTASASGARGMDPNLASRLAGSRLPGARKFGPGPRIGSTGQARGGSFNRMYIKSRVRRAQRELIDWEAEGADGVKRKKFAKKQTASDGIAGLVARVQRSWNAGDMYDLQRLGIRSRRDHATIFQVAHLTYQKKASGTVLANNARN